MKRLNFKNHFSGMKFFQKYNYDINRVIGVKDNEKYILLADKKLIRIYRDKLKATPLLCNYIPIENAIFYSFEVEKNVIENVDLDSFIETKVYTDAGLLETEEYIIKYEVITELKDDKKAVIQCVIVPVDFIKKNYTSILKKSGYIDYLSFPAFAYKALYQENILKRGNDLFVVVLFDKIFFTFYSEGELVYINTVSGGLNQIYKSLEELKISNFNLDIFKKLLTKKGINKNKYVTAEMPVYNIIEQEFRNYSTIIDEKILDLVNNYEIADVDRIFIITEYGDIPNIKEFYESILERKVFGFEFYKDYNLDKLPIDPFLFLAMIATHHAYKTQDLRYNFSLFLRNPTFFYRPSGILILSFILILILLSIYPAYLFIDGYIYNSKANQLQKKLNQLKIEKDKLSKSTKILKGKVKTLNETIGMLTKQVNHNKTLIKKVYSFKFGYLPKSKELVDITAIMNKDKVFLNSLDYKDGVYEIEVYSYNENSLGKLINDLSNNGFNVYFDELENKKGKYYTTLRIEE